MRDGDSGTSAALTLSGARRERLPDACDGHKHAADGYASAVAPADGSGMFCSSGTAATVGKLARDRVRSTRSSSSGTTVGGVKPQREAVSGGGAVWREPDPVLQAAGLREAPYNSAARDVAALLASDPTDTDTDPGSKDAATALSLDASRPADYRLPLNDAQSLLRQMLEEEEARRALPYNLTKPYKLPAASYEDEHFVFATGSYPDRYLLAQATRSWRRGVRAFIAINNTQDVDTLNERNQAHHERYEYFPDEGEGDLGPRFHGFMRGDSRAAMAPFMAHEHYGETYKWLLYGDDDTIFYMPAVKRMLAHLDPELPYAISDNLCYGRFLVGARTDADMNHGKAKRAMRTRAFQDWNKTQECFMQQFGAPGGDSLLSTCLWREGYAFTDPGTSTLAMYDGNYVLFSSEAGKWALHDPLTVLIRGKCDSRCKWLIRNAASHHGRGRHFQGFGQSAAYLYAAGEKSSWEREGESEVGLDYVPHRRGYFDSSDLK
eukprot:XP_001695957.1 predicted protein [Chlamydomonas reinhardtii]